MKMLVLALVLGIVGGTCVALFTGEAIIGVFIGLLIAVIIFAEADDSHNHHLTK